MTNEPWDGIERRAPDRRLAAAMADVRDLKVGIADLAEAVAVRGAEFKGVVRQVGFLLVGLLIVLVAFSLWQVNNIEKGLADGHREITCLLLVEPSMRTAQSLIECQRGGN